MDDVSCLPEADRVPRLLLLPPIPGLRRSEILRRLISRISEGKEVQI